MHVPFFLPFFLLETTQNNFVRQTYQQSPDICSTISLLVESLIFGEHTATGNTDAAPSFHYKLGVTKTLSLWQNYSVGVLQKGFSQKTHPFSSHLPSPMDQQVPWWTVRKHQCAIMVESPHSYKQAAFRVPLH